MINYIRFGELVQLKQYRDIPLNLLPTNVRAMVEVLQASGYKNVIGKNGVHVPIDLVERNEPGRIVNVYRNTLAAYEKWRAKYKR